MNRKEKTAITVLLTRRSEQNAELKSLLEAGELHTLEQAMIEIHPVPIPMPPQHSRFDWFVFSSPNGVHNFYTQITRFNTNNNINNNYQGISIAAVGPGTARALTLFGQNEVQIPETYCAEGLFELLRGKGIEGKRFLLIRGTEGRTFLEEELRANGGEVETLFVYETRPISKLDPEITNQLEAGKIDGITVTSGSIADTLIRLFGSKLKQTALFSISSRTSARLIQQGYPVAAESPESSIPSLADTILNYFREELEKDESKK